MASLTLLQQGDVQAKCQAKFTVPLAASLRAGATMYNNITCNFCPAARRQSLATEITIFSPSSLAPSLNCASQVSTEVHPVDHCKLNCVLISSNCVLAETWASAPYLNGNAFFDTRETDSNFSFAVCNFAVPRSRARKCICSLARRHRSTSDSSPKLENVKTS